MKDKNKNQVKKKHIDNKPDTVMEETVLKPEQEIIETTLDTNEADEFTQLQTELAEARAKAEEYLDGWQRSRADFANYKRRVERDQAIAQQMATGNVIRRYLEIADDLERALKNRPQDGEGAAWSSGIDLIYRKLLAAFEADGVTSMRVEEGYFDPNLHEAISQEDSVNHESGQIIAIVQPGYVLGDRILRPARVRVAR
jgi:molecular chaperone GrpE